MKIFPRKPSRYANGPRLGFTLTEILVTIGIIAFLAALMMPAIRSVRGKADSTRCTSNLRQVYFLLMDEIQDTSEIPMGWDVSKSTPGWMDRKYDELVKEGEGKHRVMGCPAQRKALRLPSGARTYSMNSVIVNDYWNPPPGRIPKFRDPSSVALFTDGGIRGSAPTSYNATVNMSNPPQCIHNDEKTANIAFLDGHVATLLQKDIPTGSHTLGTPGSIFWLGK